MNRSEFDTGIFGTGEDVIYGVRSQKNLVCLGRPSIQCTGFWGKKNLPAELMGSFLNPSISEALKKPLG